MLRYTLFFALIAPLLFLLTYIEGLSPFFFLNDLQTELTVILTGYGVALTGLPVEMAGPLMLFDNGVRLLIHYTCNALAPILLFFAAVLAYPTFWQTKLRWLLAGYVILVLLNLIRMLLVSYAVSVRPESFELAHDYVGRYGVAALTVALFYLFTERSELNRKKT